MSHVHVHIARNMMYVHWTWFHAITCNPGRILKQEKDVVPDICLKLLQFPYRETLNKRCLEKTALKTLASRFLIELGQRIGFSGRLLDLSSLQQTYDTVHSFPKPSGIHHVNGWMFLRCENTKTISGVQPDALFFGGRCLLEASKNLVVYGVGDAPVSSGAEWLIGHFH